MNSKQPESMSGSQPLHTFQSTKTNLDSDNEFANKTSSRFPPIMKSKEDSSFSTKQNLKELGLYKKVSEEAQVNYKKTVPIKKNAKKKQKFLQIKPQTLQKYKSYLDFTSLVALTNNVRIVVTQKLPNYVLYVGKGNNSSLIKSLFKTNRPWWTIEQTSSDNPNINMFWYQLRQNDILDRFKDSLKGDSDFQHCEYYQQQEQKTEKKEQQTSVIQRTQKTQQIRSQSVTQKQIKATFKIGVTKRSSSRAKGLSNQKVMPIPSGLSTMKEQLQIGQEQGKKKKLANPKMWAIYNIYRRIFSQSELKQIKKLKALTEQGKLTAPLSRNKIKTYENRSNYFRIHNHLTNNWNLSNKKALFMNLKNYYQAQKINPFEYIPMTFHVTEIGDKDFLKFQEQYDRRAEAIKEQDKKNKNTQFKHAFKAKKRNAWLVKPGQNTNRGTGIEVLQSIEDIKEKILQQKVDNQGRLRTHILQEYIMPFLYQKRKFDIRSYICVTSCNGYQKGYWYQDGYIRTASKQFNMKNLNNKFIHLTNDAVQKYHEDYGKFEPANKISFSQFQRYLDTVYNSNSEGPKFKFYSQAYPQMKKLAADSIRSVYSKMNPTKKEFSFEIFGLDFLIDENFKVWLIEANTNPCLELACPLLGRIIPTMLENAFKIVIDPIFPPPPVEVLVDGLKKLVLPQNLLENNKFELIFDEVEEGKQLKLLMSNAPDIKIQEVDEEEQEYQQGDNVCKIQH